MTIRPLPFFFALMLSACAAATPTPMDSHSDHLPSQASNAVAQVSEPGRNELTKNPSEFHIDFGTTLSSVRPGQESMLAFTINRGASPVKDFKVEHEKLLHFILVRNDLTQFQHLHPDLQPTTGQFTVPVTLNEPGTYAIFADFEPATGEATVLRTDTVVVTPSSSTVLNADTGPQTDAGYTVTPTVESPLPAGPGQMFIFDITKDGKTVIDLQNYLGAKGHAVIFKEGSLDYLHAHPSEHGGGHGGMVAAGPGEVIFMADLPTPGRYRVFQQYRPEGQLITVAHTYEVTAIPDQGSMGMDHASMEPTKELSVEAFQWGFSPNVIRVKKGTRLMFHLTSRDVAHSFTLPAYDISETILPGKTAVADFVADKQGTFSFGCDIAWGKGHDHMAEAGGTLIVE